MDAEAGMREACGIFGCVAAAKWPTQLDVPQIIYLGLIGLQHRGQESSGIVTSEGIGKKLKYHKGMGEVNEVFKNDALMKLRGNLGIGHNMYTTVGESEILRCQPFVVHTLRGTIAVAHNGELINTIQLREKMLGKGIGLSTSSDTELIAQLLAEPPPDGESNGCDFPARIKRLMVLCSISYSLVILYGEYIYAVRDPLGNRPLCLGTLYLPSKDDPTASTDPEGWVIASESCVFFSIGAKYLREVEPGEIVRVSKYGIEHICTVDRPEDKFTAFCIFEYVYFSRTDSIYEGQMVYTVRQRCGRQLARETPADVDIVAAVPDTAIPAALGYAAELNIPYAEVLTKNRYIGRTFIQPSQHLRKLGVSKKFGVLTETFQGKRVALLDDSIVRGNTIGPIIHMLRKAGAKEVHIRIASPPLLYPCYMGINIATREELIANQVPPVQLAEYFGADSLAYLSLEGLISAVEENIKDLDSKKLGHCTACLTGNYPAPLCW